MPVTMRQKYGQRSIDERGWDFFPGVMEQLPNLGGLTFWKGDPDETWYDRVDGATVNRARTTKLAEGAVGDTEIKCSTKLYEGIVPGSPYQRVDGVKNTLVHSNDVFGSATWLPLPPVVTRFGDPAGWDTDLQWTGIDLERGLIFEAASIANDGWRTALASWFRQPEQWQSGMVAISDLSKPFKASKSICAGRIQLLPLMPLDEELKSGRIDHALALLGPGAKGEWIAPARGTDAQIQGHPLRYGERVRLNAARGREILSKLPVNDVQSRAIVVCLMEYGAIMNDRTGPHATVRLPMGRGVGVNVPGMSYRDLEIVSSG